MDTGICHFPHKTGHNPQHIIMNRLRGAIVSAILIFFVLIISDRIYCNLKDSKRVTVIFRCDDFFAVEGHPIKEIYETKEKIIRIFKENNIPLTIGIIPNVHNSISEAIVPYKRLTKNDPTAQLLREVANNKNFEMALHGLTHFPNKISNNSEWIGLSYETQRAKIKEAKDILREALGKEDIVTFIPPWNSFDLNTVKGLKANGFEYLSGDVGIVKNSSFTLRNDSEKEYLYISMIPGTSSLFELKEVLQLAKKDLSDTIITVVIHPYDFQEYRGIRAKKKAFFSLSDLDNILKDIKSDDQLYFLRIRDLAPSKINASHYTAASRYYLLLKSSEFLLPRSMSDYMGFTDAGIGSWLDKGRYLSEEMYKELYFRIFFLLTASIISSSIIMYIVIKVYFSDNLKKAKRVILISVCMLFLIGLVSFQKQWEIITSPNMQGILYIYCEFFVSIYLSVSVSLPGMEY